ncbi:hypothetical protein ZEAMMB73_Zm00001d002324 [Zea mays]|uniref:Uncharacterized protein n=1 Tax=Zea mays TaxID=4577 RepID=A0A1D6DZK2_MAIZE|nr:hypothetical protein ZEAMMB73_Zm00001d002324 [Zea mays]
MMGSTAYAYSAAPTSGSLGRRCSLQTTNACCKSKESESSKALDWWNLYKVRGNRRYSVAMCRVYACLFVRLGIS